jgi:hypothetical protein
MRMMRPPFSPISVAKEGSLAQREGQFFHGPADDMGLWHFQGIVKWPFKAFAIVLV